MSDIQSLKNDLITQLRSVLNELGLDELYSKLSQLELQTDNVETKLNEVLKHLNNLESKSVSSSSKKPKSTNGGAKTQIQNGLTYMKSIYAEEVSNGNTGPLHDKLSEMKIDDTPLIEYVRESDVYKKYVDANSKDTVKCNRKLGELMWGYIKDHKPNSTDVPKWSKIISDMRAEYNANLNNNNSDSQSQQDKGSIICELDKL